MEVINVRWYTSRTCVGVVLCEREDGTVGCYMGSGYGENEQEDIEDIKNYGAKVEYTVAKAIFPCNNLDNYRR